MGEKQGHTPGPWMAQHTGFYWQVGSAEGTVADACPSQFIDGGTIETPSPREKANARLIAAAPDLLAALIEARDALHQHYVDWDGEPEDAVPLQLARSKCDAAISRATMRSRASLNVTSPRAIWGA